MNRQIIIIALLVCFVGQLHAERKQGSHIIVPEPKGKTTATVQAEVTIEVEDADNDSRSKTERIRITVDKSLENISAKLTQLQEGFEYICDNRKELINKGKYDERKKAFEKKLNAVYDSTKGYMSRISPKTEQFIVKLDNQCYQRDQRIKPLDVDISVLAKTQAEAKQKLGSLTVTSSGYVAAKTAYYRGQIRLNTLRAKVASLKTANAAEQLVVSTYYSMRAIRELHAEYQQQLEHQPGERSLILEK